MLILSNLTHLPHLLAFSQPQLPGLLMLPVYTAGFLLTGH